MKRATIKTTREQYLVEKHPNIEFKNGNVEFYVRHSRDNEAPEQIFLAKNQDVGILPFDMAIVKEKVQTLKKGNGISAYQTEEVMRQTIYSLITEKVVMAGLNWESKVEYITEDQMLKGFLVTDFEHQTVFDKFGNQVYQTELGKQVMSAGEFIKCKTTYLKIRNVDGTTKLVSFEGNELPLKDDLVLDAIQTESQTILTCEYGKEMPSYWLNEQLKEIACFQPGYSVVEILDSHSTRVLKKRLPQWMNVETTMKTEIIDGEEIHYPSHKLQDIEWTRKENILWDESCQIFYVIRMNSGRVEIYHYEGDNKENLQIEQIGEIQTTVRVIPLF